jgi:HAD superfamily hydrolase (TIGR01490 family)
MTRPFAVFDIDGTIIRWQLYHAIGDGLAKRGVIGPEAFRQVREARMNWKRRSGEELFRTYELELVKALDTAVAGLEVEVLSEVADQVFDEYKEQVYTYSRDLIRKLKREGYLLFAISGSPAIIVEKLAKYYGFDDFAATEYPASNGRYLGTKALSLGKKPELLQKLIEKHGASSAGSLGVGDSEGDIDMLEIVEQPIALNPTKQLFQLASAKGWKIVLERKNMIYELEPRDGKYILAQTNA